MLLDLRIERYLQNEHAALRRAVAHASQAIVGLRTERTSTPAAAPRRTGAAPTSPEPSTDPARRTLKTHLAVQDAWAAFATPLEAHLGREERVLATARRVLGGDTAHRAPMLIVLQRFEVEHAELRSLAGHLRAAAMLHEDARRPVVAVLDAYDTATRAQEIEIYPALLAGSELAFQLGQTPVPLHYQRTDTHLRSIRSRSPLAAPGATEPEAEAVSKTFVDRLRRLIGR